ncbi:hypothetical protein B0H15DRAFT_864024 [Mycena belliarum]|uniref:Uncharacterized protein n=1 Tax=Mycena belliarum TaxID=1033014 RepID=A0AAD6XK03_9AGAR|nr:hypothetical protein B0H15DRAFT_864021 [Mycena belliae]KAJ7076492.1 hypothetical protein B0H15DRAFT_864024 [Mycena belliae]
MGLSLLGSSTYSGTCLHWPRSNTPTLFAALTHGPPLTAHTVLVRRPPSARCPRRRPCTRSTSSTARTCSPPRPHVAAATLRVLPREHPHPRPRLCQRRACDARLDSTTLSMPIRALPALSPPRNERPRPQSKRPFRTSSKASPVLYSAHVRRRHGRRAPPRTVYARLHATACIEPDSRQRRHARAPRTTRNGRWETRCTTQGTSQRSRRIALSALCDCY